MKKIDNIAEKIKKGDLSSFEKLFRHYYQALCGYANTYLNDMDLAEEFVQDVFTILWERREAIDIETSLQSYIYKSVKNKCLMHLRHEKVKKTHAKQLEEMYNSTSNKTAEVSGMFELQDIINKTLNLLPDRCRKIFTMNRFEGLKYKEIAEYMSLSIKTIEADMGRALKVFRDALKDYRMVE